MTRTGKLAAGMYTPVELLLRVRRHALHASANPTQTRMVCSNLSAPVIDLSAPYLQRAVVEMLLLAVPAGLLGSWIVLRRLAFFTHAVGTVSFPALVVASAWGIAPQLAALVAALGFGVAQERVTRTRRLADDAATGLLLVGALAAGVVLASDVYESGAGVDRLLFGSLIGLTDRDLWLTAAVAAGAIVLDRALRRHWLVAGFEPGSAQALGMQPVLADRLLLVGVALAAVVALDAVGALLVTVVLVVPAATARLLTARLATLQLTAIALAAIEGYLAVWLANELNVGAGPALAVLGGSVFAVVAAATARGRAVAA
jgi:ABC-type Mn2+/Zn2+ transport system permease subunit